jgi:menaquinone-9 beta-reductase
VEDAGVAIIGAGPAGSTLATLLARRGVDVALIDRDEFPRDKLCGEFLSYDAIPVLDRLGLTAELDRRGAPSIDHCRVVGRKRTYEFAFPRPARGVSRMLLDDLLFRAAVSSGARDFSGWTAESVAPDLVISKNGERRSLRARAIAGAWGRWGRFDAQLGRRFVRDRSHRNFGFKRHYRAAVPRTTIDLYSFERGYLGVSAVENGVTNICGLVHASRISGLKGGWEAFIETIRGEELRLEQLYASHQPTQPNFLSSDPVIFRSRAPVENGIWMIGDASGIVDPLTGNGMAMAMQSAAIAARWIGRMLDGADARASQDGYAVAHSEFFRSRIRWSRRVAILLSHPRLLDASLGLVRSPAAGEFLLRRTRASERALTGVLVD